MGVSICLKNPKIALGSRNTSKMSAALFGSIACAVQREALARPVAALVTASSPRRAMSDKGNQDGTVGSAGDSFKKREKAEEARYFNKLQSEQLEKLHKKHEKRKGKGEEEGEGRLRDRVLIQSQNVSTSK